MARHTRQLKKSEMGPVPEASNERNAPATPARGQRIADEFAGFCEREQSRLVAAVGLYCGDFDVAEEIAQEALARVWRDWSKVCKKESPAAWTQRVAINLANSHFRRKQAERRARDRLDRPADAVEDLSIDDRLTLQSALAQLPARQRAVLIMRFYLDYSVAQTAAALGIPEGTVMTHTSRGLERLRRRMGSASPLVEVSHV